jgi:hypothetical protein
MNIPSATTPRWSIRTMREAAESGDLATAAGRFSAAGIPVFPCVPSGKQPLTPHGFHDATADPTQVREWWRRTPDANIGLPTGAISGVVVVDVDVHDRGNGFEAFERARAAGLVAPWGWVVRTPSGGLHAYFPPGSVEQRSWQVPGQHIDFRGDGGYVVVPPSQLATADGRVQAYEVIAVAQHRPRPLDSSALRAFLEPPRQNRPPTGVPALGSRPEKLAAWVASRPEGARNHGLFWAACRMAEDGYGVDATLGLLGDAACSSGLTKREAETTIRSAHRSAAPLSTGSGPCPTSAAKAVGL